MIGSRLVKLKQHENSSEHTTNMNTSNELRIRLDENQTIDIHLQEEIMKEKERWRQFLHRIFSIVKCLVKNNIAFRGSKEQLLKIVKSIFLD